MTALLSIIVFALIVLIILAGIGVFNLRCICNYCDFIHSEQYHHQGILNSINTILSQIQINQAQDNNQIIDHLKAVCDSIKVATIRLEDIRANTAYEPDDFTIDDDLPFLEDEPTPEKNDGFGRGKYEPFEMSDNTTLDVIVDAFKNRRIAIRCASEDEFNTMLDVFDSYKLQTLTQESPLVLKGAYTATGNNAFGYLEKPVNDIMAIIMDIMAGGTKGVSMGKADEYSEGGWCVIDFSEFANLIPTKQTNEESEPNDETVKIENPGALLRAIRDEKLAKGDYIDCSESAAETPEKASEDIPAAPVESDDTEDKGETDA